MDTYTIGEVAERTGFTASALRYYEGIGLVAPAARTDARYRLYDDAAVARLAFIARAKELGCSLEEITDLTSVWDGERCGPVQRRFHDLVTDKLDDAHRRIAELTAFSAQLRSAADQLAGPADDGPCRADCACLAESAPPAPIVCTLDEAGVPDRLEQWQAVLARARSRTATADGGLRVEFDPDVDVAELGRLVAAEQRCCAFFAFTLTVDAGGTALVMQAPEEAGDVVASLFGPPR